MPNAIKVMMEFLREIPIKGPTKPYDPTAYDPRLVQSYGGFTGPMQPQMGGHGGMGGGGMPAGGWRQLFITIKYTF
jgi:hypothetical protein